MNDYTWHLACTSYTVKCNCMCAATELITLAAWPMFCWRHTHITFVYSFINGPISLLFHHAWAWAYGSTKLMHQNLAPTPPTAFNQRHQRWPFFVIQLQTLNDVFWFEFKIVLHKQTHTHSLREYCRPWWNLQISFFSSVVVVVIVKLLKINVTHCMCNTIRTWFLIQ